MDNKYDWIVVGDAKMDVAQRMLKVFSYKLNTQNEITK
jgi:hypothetical protein